MLSCSYGNDVGVDNDVILLLSSSRILIYMYISPSNVTVQHTILRQEVEPVTNRGRRVDAEPRLIPKYGRWVARRFGPLIDGRSFGPTCAKRVRHVTASGDF